MIMLELILWAFTAACMGIAFFGPVVLFVRWAHKKFDS
jgi:hypothetical protein